MIHRDIDTLLTRQAWSVEPGLYSVLEDLGGAGSDRKAWLYDRLVGSRACNALVWGTPVEWHRSVAARAAATAKGPLLDAGCGTARFTAEPWRSAARPLLLIDRSLSMLRRARARVGSVATLLHADLETLPVRPGTVDTVCCFGVVHLLQDPDPILRQLWCAVAPGGQLWVTGIVVVDARIPSAWYAVLERAGEVAPPRRVEELADRLARITEGDPQVEVQGAFALLRMHKARVDATR